MTARAGRHTAKQEQKQSGIADTARRAGTDGSEDPAAIQRKYRQQITGCQQQIQKRKNRNGMTQQGKKDYIYRRSGSGCEAGLPPLHRRRVQHRPGETDLQE